MSTRTGWASPQARARQLLLFKVEVEVRVDGRLSLFPWLERREVGVFERRPRAATIVRLEHQQFIEKFDDELRRKRMARFG